MSVSLASFGPQYVYQIKTRRSNTAAALQTAGPAWQSVYEMNTEKTQKELEMQLQESKQTGKSNLRTNRKRIIIL